MNAIEIRGLTHSYQSNFWEKRKFALDSLDMDVSEGEIFGFLGANGAGKTTTIKILVGLQTQTGGKAAIFGMPVSDPRCRGMIGFMPENPYFYEYLTARESLDFYAALCGLPARERRPRIPELLEFVGLSDAVDVRLKEFSKGMRQRLGIAQAIVHRPRLAILDEPMSGLDPLGRLQVREAILNLHKGGTTIFFSTHILSDVELVCDRVALIGKGRMIACGPLSQLLDARAKGIEVVAEKLADGDREALAKTAGSVIAAGSETAFVFGDWERADAAVRRIVDRAHLVSVRPVKESLEEYFMRTAGQSRTEVGEWSGGHER